MKVRATSYGMGKPIASVEFETPSLRAAVRAPEVRLLPAGSRSQNGGLIQAIGIQGLR